MRGKSKKYMDKQIKDMTYQLRRIGNNLNQYAKRATESGSIYAVDIEDLKTEFDDSRRQSRDIIGRLTTI